jgi:hypothetical protein
MEQCVSKANSLVLLKIAVFLHSSNREAEA